MANPEHERVLWQAHLNRERVDASGFDLSGLRLTSAHLEGANLANADLEKADLSGAYLKDCNLSGATLRKVRLVLGDLRNANLSNADLTGCDLNSSVLCDANLASANLTRAGLVKTRLDRANFTGANLDRADLRGVHGLTAEQLDSAQNSDKAILDERMLAALGRQGDEQIARHGRPVRKARNQNNVDLTFRHPKPTFGDLFLLCGQPHPDFPPSGEFGFSQLADLGFEQVDDYYAICNDGDPVIWLYPLVKGSVVEHHHGPYDGIRIELAEKKHKKLWLSCIARFRETLPLATDE